jgi:hypothetical protein
MSIFWTCTLFVSLCCWPLLCVHSSNNPCAVLLYSSLNDCAKLCHTFLYTHNKNTYIYVHTQQQKVTSTHLPAQHTYVTACSVIHTPLTFCSNQRWAGKMADHMSNRIIKFCNYITVLRQSLVTCRIARSSIIKYYVSTQFTHYLLPFLCTTTNSLHKSNRTVTITKPLPQFHTKLLTFPHRWY